jgi:hypothetical protein
VLGWFQAAGLILSDPRIKRQARPWPEPSASARSFSMSRYLLPSWSGAARFRASALPLAVGRLSAYSGLAASHADDESQGWRNATVW